MRRTRHPFVAAALATVALVTALTVAQHLDPPAASAATTGAGVPGLTPYGNFLGNFIAPDGTRVYCIDSARAWPEGTTSGADLVSSVQATWGPMLPESSLQKLNYALTAYGQTDDPIQAAAVAAFVYAYTSGWARDLGPGYAAGAFYLNGNSAVTAVYDAIWSDVEAHAMPAPAATVEIRMSDSTAGVVIVTAPDAAGTLVLTGAVTDTGESSATLAGPVEIPIRGLPADDEGSYSIGAEVSFTIVTPAAANVVLYATGDQQRTIRGGTPGEIHFGARASTDPIALDFSPVVSTAVAAVTVEPGQAFVDLVTAAVAEGSRPWRVLSDGSFVPVIATGVLYGPFAEQPATTDDVPGDAPVVGHETLVLPGPGTHPSGSSLIAATAGYYTWVWTIERSEQPPAIKSSLPGDYVWSSPFGLVEETHVVPAQLAATGSAPGGIGAAAALMLVTGTGLGITARKRRCTPRD